MANPKPRPIEVTRKLGNPGHKALPKITSVTTLQTANKVMPAHLSPAGAAVWEHVTTFCPWFGQCDRQALIELCDLVDLRALLVTQIRADGVTVLTPSNGQTAHPNWTQVIALTKQIHGLMSLFGLTPSDRGRIGLGEVTAKSKLEALRQMEGK